MYFMLMKNQKLTFKLVSNDPEATKSPYG